MNTNCDICARICASRAALRQHRHRAHGVNLPRPKHYQHSAEWLAQPVHHWNRPSGLTYKPRKQVKPAATMPILEPVKPVEPPIISSKPHYTYPKPEEHIYPIPCKPPKEKKSDFWERIKMRARARMI